ncbi:hypothetical protein BAE44_0005285 [Dichanthelium oligosanthes]|uniref:Protein kinase domain-containing protein n=1 Tax=Dichanthelium oligosanthes TaxID=888268 RepID=A0A1E5W8L3_9POAL|nr:hypothetical protein BAE44_0005285 [Dichanthelium oligosanthes]
MGKEQSRVVTTVRGTTGYLAPEWLLGAGVTEKSDVYSYGMVLMEMLGGRRNLQAEPPASNKSEPINCSPLSTEQSSAPAHHTQRKNALIG